MTDIDWGYVVRIVITLIFSIFAVSGLFGYFYLSIGGFYRKRENRWWIGLLAIGLPFIILTMGLFIWMLWNPLVSALFWALLCLCIVISFLLGQSITSPHKLADWWIEFDKWLKKRNPR